MCLLVLAWKAHPRYQLIVAANRDEYHDRPSAPLAKWAPPSDILAGRDLRAGGTWLGVDRQRRFAIITNYRDLQPPRTGAPSRGELIPNYLSGSSGASDYARGLESKAAEYSGFNLLFADADSLWYAANRATPFARALTPGVHGLSNELLDSPWPKLLRVRSRFEAWLLGSSATPAADLFGMLDDREPTGRPASPSLESLPPELARALSAPFVVHPKFGTRSATVLLMEPSGALTLAERRFNANGALAGETAFDLGPGEWP